MLIPMKLNNEKHLFQKFSSGFTSQYYEATVQQRKHRRYYSASFVILVQ